MAFCTKCGTKLDEDAHFCKNCGAAVGGAPNGGNFNSASTSGGASFDFINTADTTCDFDANDISKNKAMAILSYIGILVLIPIFAAKNSRFARFHANQGLILLLADVIYNIIVGIIGSILTAISWHLAFISNIFGIINIVFVLLMIFGIINAANGKAKELPVIGSIRILK